MADFLKIGELKENITNLVEAKIELAKLNVQDKVEGVAIKAAHAIIVAVVALMMLIFASILAAIGLNYWLDSFWIGYLIIFGIYTIFLLIFIFAKSKIINSIKKKVAALVDEHINI